MAAGGGVGKQLSTIKYEDLLISSKFFYTEGNEDTDMIFPDETKQYPKLGFDQHSNHEILQHAAAKSDEASLCSTHFESTKTTLTALDVDVAMETACGDTTFLVSEN